VRGDFKLAFIFIFNMTTGLIIASITEEYPGFKTIGFVPGHGLQYKAGQYLTLSGVGGFPGLRRSYSIVSSPLLSEPLAIGVQRIDNGQASRWLIDKARVGDQIDTTGVGGFFVLPEQLEPDALFVFLAAGSGITPIISLIKTILHGHPTATILLVYSNASKERTVYYQTLIGLQQHFPARMNIEFIYSNNKYLYRAHLNRELLLELVYGFTGNSPDKAWYYTCGPEAYMRFCSYTLQQTGVSPARIRRELFQVQKPLPPATPPDRQPHIVSLNWRNSIHRFLVQYPDTILTVALRNGIDLPYSCRTGRCGSCVLHCTEGKVWMSNNEVLTDLELEAGWILSCVGYPVDGAVELRGDM
jgi:ferredoxin-NADP reductase